MPCGLTAMSIDEARAVKWARGRAQYGPAFVGHPLEELDGELLDGLNYCEGAARWGYDLGDIPARLMAICEEVQAIDRYRAGHAVLTTSCPAT